MIDDDAMMPKRAADARVTIRLERSPDRLHAASGLAIVETCGQGGFGADRSADPVVRQRDHGDGNDGPRGYSSLFSPFRKLGINGIVIDYPLECRDLVLLFPQWDSRLHVVIERSSLVFAHPILIR
jgi:hypothetical protein